MPEWEVVSDELRPKLEHRGARTPEYFLAMMDGKTVRLDRRPGSLRKMADRWGFVGHYYEERDSEDNKTGQFIAWLTKKEV